MNTIQIANALINNKSTRKYFQGVFPSDKLPKHITKRPAIFIANTDPAHKAGQHWVAFYFHDFNNAEYFDSYGQPPLNLDLIKFLKNNSKQNIINSRQLQGFFSKTCGHYCLLYSLYKSQNKSLKLFLMEFNKQNLNFNDRKVVQHCKRYFSLK